MNDDRIREASTAVSAGIEGLRQVLVTMAAAADAGELEAVSSYMQGARPSDPELLRAWLLSRIGRADELSVCELAGFWKKVLDRLEPGPRQCPLRRSTLH
jgi:hypothetical protein